MTQVDEAQHALGHFVFCLRSVMPNLGAVFKDEFLQCNKVCKWPSMLHSFNYHNVFITWKMWSEYNLDGLGAWPTPSLSLSCWILHSHLCYCWRLLPLPLTKLSTALLLDWLTFACLISSFACGLLGPFYILWECLLALFEAIFLWHHLVSNGLINSSHIPECTLLLCPPF